MDEASDDWDNSCPLCMEEMDCTDRQLKPCQCGYEICVWCWNHIMEMAEKDSTEGRCPACRTPYDKEKIVSTTVNCDRLTDVTDKKQKFSKAKAKAAEGRKNLSNVRVIQRNLVYVVGVPATLADEETLERKEYFGQYGKVLKISVSKSGGHSSQHSMVAPTVSVYVTYVKEEDALRCIQAVNGCILEGKVLKACFGTTKYCNAWLKHMPCNNPDCLYLHDEGTREDSFTKEEMLAKYGSKNQHFHELTHPSQRSSGVGLPPPLADVSTMPSTSHALAIPGNVTKPSLSNGTFMRHSSLPAAASWGSRATSSSVRAAQGRNGAASPSAKSKIGAGPTVSPSHATIAFSSPTVLGTSGTSASGQLLQTSSGKQYGGVKGMKSNVTDGINVPLSVSSCSAATARFLEVMNSEAVTSTRVQEGTGFLGVDPRNVSFVDGVDGQGKAEDAGTMSSWVAHRSSRAIAKEDVGTDIPSKVMTDVNLGDQLLSTSPCTSASVDGKHLVVVSTEKEGGASPAENSFGIDGANSIESSNISSCGSSQIGEDVMEALADSDFLAYGRQKQSRFDNNDKSGSNVQLSTSDTALISTLGNATQDSFVLEKQAITRKLEVPKRPHCSSEMATHNKPANTCNDPMQAASLSVGGLSIHLDADASSSLNPNTKEGIASSKDAWPDPLPSIALESTSNASEELLSCAMNNKLSIQGASHSGKQSGRGKRNGYLELEEGSTKAGGEHELISDMFEMGFDIWADGSPQDLANLLFNGKQMESPSLSNSKEIPSSWKLSSSKQSRFDFARLDEAAEAISPILSQTSASGFANLIDHQMRPEIYSMNLSSSDLSSLSEALIGAASSSFNDRLLNKASSSHTSADSLGAVISSNPKSSISTPPGFFASPRVPVVSPPGFPPQSRPPDFRTSEDARQDSETSRSLASSGIYNALEAVNSASDVEFFDPAIMAVGKGKMPAGMRQAAPFTGKSPISGVFSQAQSIAIPLQQQPRPLNFDSSLPLQRHMYGSFGSMNSHSPLGFANQEPDGSIPSLFPPSFGEVMSAPRVAGQYHNALGSSVSHIGMQEQGYGNGVSKVRLQQSSGSAWDDWNRLTSSTEAITGGQRLFTDAVGRMNVSQMSLDRALQNRLEELALSKELDSNYYGDAVSLAGQDDQGPFKSSRISRYYLQK